LFVNGFDRKWKDKEMSVTGIWNIAVAAPIGTQHAVLELTEKDGGVAGVVSYAGQTLPLLTPTLNGNRLTWQLLPDKPHVLITYDVTINGDTFTGTSTPESHPSVSVTGTRAIEK
jgi:hypothetical protein